MSSREVVVITGATSGVGRALARRFASDRALVAILARGEEGLRGTVEDVENAGGSALAIPTDVADHEQVDQAARRVVEEWGGIDIWVNNAMTTIFAPFTEIMPEEFRRATEVTYLGVVWGTRTALDHMIPNNSGAIMQVGSALAYRGIPLQSPYCGAKHAIKGFTESLRSELLHYGHDITWGWPSSLRSTPHSSPTAAPSSTVTPSRCLRSTNRRWPPKPFIWQYGSGAASSMSPGRRSRPLSGTSWDQGS
jgi:NAD(P)-dependent dehydrogenase (short-subunit alcohol dehydrogenase family)